MEIWIQCDTNIELKLYITIYVGQWPTVRGPVVLPYILKTIWWTNVIIGILDPFDAKINHIKYMWGNDSDLYLEDVLMEECWTDTLSLTYNYICRSMAYILWYSDSALYFQYYLMNKPHLWILVLIWAIDPYFMIEILNHLPVSAKFDTKICVNVARLEIGQLFTQATRRGHPCTLDTFLV